MSQRTRVIFVRHGQAVLNAADVVLGTMESPLSPLGVEQAKERAKMLVSFNPSRLYSSELVRAKETARVIGQHLGLSIFIEPLLNERFVGTEVQGKSNTQVREMFAGEVAEIESLPFEQQLRFRFTCTPDAETADEALIRLDRFLQKMAKLYLGEVVVAVTHAALLGPFLVRAGLFPWEGPFASDAIGNTTVFVVETDGVKHALLP